MYMVWLTLTLAFALAFGIFALPATFETADHGDARARAIALNLVSWHGAATRHVADEAAAGRNVSGTVSLPDDPWRLADYGAFAAWHSLRHDDVVVTFVTPEEQAALGKDGLAFMADSVLREATHALRGPYHVGVLENGRVVSPVDATEIEADPDCPLSPFALGMPIPDDPRYAGCTGGYTQESEPPALGVPGIPDGSWVVVSGVPAP